jgi:hypothetical protein
MMYVSNLLTRTMSYKLVLIALVLVLSACKEQGNNETDNGASGLVDNGGGSGVNNAPSLTIDSPVSGSTFTSDQSIALVASASDDEDGDLSQSIRWRSSRDGDLGTGHSLSVILSQGQHTITASVTDSGNQSSETSIAIEVLAPEPVNQVPQLTINSPSNNAQFEQGQSITFSATATDDEDGDLSGNIQWQSSIDGALGQGATLSAGLSVGSHTVTATVTDSGNLSVSRSITVNVNPATPENSAPQVSIQSPVNGSSFTNDESIVLTATAADNEDGNLSQSIVWSSSVDGVLGTGASLSVTLSQGQHTITASVTDSGNLSSSSSVSINVNEATPVNTAPQISLSSPSNGGNYDDQTAVLLSAIATDAEDGDLSQLISWSSDRDGNLGSGASLSVLLSAGSHTLTAQVADSGGLSSQVSVTLEVTHVNQSPVITITSPADGASANDDETVSFTATANDQEDGDLAQNILWSSSIDGQLGSGSHLIATLSQGTHQITARVTDSDNATSEATISISVTHVNAAPSLTILSPTNGSQFGEGTTVTLSGSADDAEDGDLSSSIMWVSDLDGVLGTGASIDVQLTSGTHTITATVTDSEGSSEEQLVSLTINATSGVATVTWTPPTENTDNSPLTDLAGFKIYYGVDQNQLTETLVIEDPNATSWDISELAENTTYYFAVTAFNSQGVESELSNIVSKTIN